MHKSYKLYIGLRDRNGNPQDRDNSQWWVTERLDEFGIDSFLIVDGVGVWKGTAEKCLVVEVISKDDIKQDLETVADWLTQDLKQEAILMTIQEVEQTLIYRTAL